MAAIIDIGSNSVRLLINGQKTTVTTRISEGLARTGVLDEQAMSRTLETLCGFSETASAAGEKVYAFATEPLRAAANAGEFIKRVRRDAGFDIQVISGTEEAELAYIGACGKGDGGVIDIGGASVEIICGSGGEIVYEKSLPVGMIRLTEASGGDAAKMTAIIAENLPRYGKVPRLGAMYGVGGTFTSLAAMAHGLKVYDPTVVHGTVLTMDALRGIADTLVLLRGDIDKIMHAYPVLKAPRAGIITAGALFAYNALKYIGAADITVSEHDNLEGYKIKHDL